MKRKVTDLKPNEAILISNDSERDAILQLMEDAGMRWNGNQSAFRYIPDVNYDYCLTYKSEGNDGIVVLLNYSRKYEGFIVIPATDFIGSEGESVDEGSTIESVFKLADWILKHRVSSLIDADIPQQDKDRIARHFGYSADLTNP